MPVRGIDKLNGKIDRLMRTLRDIVPKRIAADAERHFKESFRNQGFTDTSLVRWRATKGGKKGRTLKASGALMNSIKGTANGMAVRVTAGGQHVPYARIHNEGGTIQRQVTRRAHYRNAHTRRTKRGKQEVPGAMVRRHQARMNLHLPKRQYMGRSAVLTRTMKATILRSIAQVVNS